MSYELSDQTYLAQFRRDTLIAMMRREHATPGGLGKLGIVIGKDVQYCSACGANIATDDGHCSNIHCWLGRETEPLQQAMVRRATNEMSKM